MKKITLLLFVAAQSIFAQQFQLDTTYGAAANGFAEFGSQSSTMTAPKFIVQSDDTALYAVTRINGSNTIENILVKFTAAGVLDTSFATSGIYTFPGSDDNGPDIFVVNNKIMAFCSGATVSTIYRLNADGTLDTSFGSGGSVTLNEKIGNNAVVYDGSTFYVGVNNYAIYAYDTDGNLVTSFGNAGHINTSERIVELIKTNDGKFLNNNQSEKLTKYNTDGSIDTSFATNGVYTMTETMINNVTSVKQMADGSLIVMKFVPLTFATEVIKLTPSGVQDSSFATNGVYTVSGHLLADAIEYNGKIVVGGGGVPVANAYLMGFNPSTGVLDAAFGNSGIYDETTNATAETAMKLYGNGATFYIGGRYTSGANYTYYLAKYTVTNLATNTLNIQNIRYNNPVTSVFEVQNIAVKSIEIFDLQGKKIATSNTNTIDMSTFSQGVYIAKIADEKGNNANIKVIKK